MWILIAISGYLFFSINGLVDKLVLSKVNKPRVYAATVGTLGLLGLVFVFFGFSWPSIWIIFVSLFAGMLYTLGLVPFYKAIKMGQTSRVVSFVGGFIPVFVLILASISGIESLSSKQLIAFFVIIIGGIVISYKKKKRGKPKLTFVWAALGALLLGGFYFLSKYIFLESDFVSGFVIMRVGGFLGSLILFIYPQTLKLVLKEIKGRNKKSTQAKASLILISQVSAAIAFVLVNYAISIGKVSLVNAMAGTQFAFLLILTLIFAKRFPQLKENITKKVIIQKSIAILLIAFGLYLLF